MAVDRKRTYDKRNRLKQLRAFCRTARLNSITRAAETFGVSQPSVSLQIRQLENELGIVLFDRSGSGIALTRAGERFFQLAEPLVQGMDDLPVALMEQPDDATPDSIQLAATAVGAACILPHYVKRFRDSWPEIRVEVKNCLQREALDLLRGDEVEFAFGAKDPDPDDTLEFRQIVPYDIVLITSIDHPLAGRKTVSLEEASAWPAIVPAAGTYSRRFGDSAARQFGVDVKAVIEVGGWGVIKRYVEHGLGISVVPSVSILESDRVAVIPLKEDFPTRSYGVFTRRYKYLMPHAQRFLRLMIPDFPDSVPGPLRHVLVDGGVTALARSAVVSRACVRRVPRPTRAGWQAIPRSWR